MREVLVSNPAEKRTGFFLMGRDVPRPGARLFIWVLISKGGPIEIGEALWAPLAPTTNLVK